MFLRNFWYAAGWSEEIGREPVGYVMLNQPVMLFRKKDGTPVALEDRCAHRRLPLSKGKILGDTVVCGYHGLTYDGTGVCIHVPGQSPVPFHLRVKCYPVAERYGCVWVWMGEPARADKALIPDLHWAEKPGWGEKNRLHVKCHYQLINDNLGDLSHLGYVHAANVGNTALAEHGEVETVVNGDNVVVSRWTMDKPAPLSYVEIGGFNANIDRWQISDFSPPGLFKLTFGAAPAGTGARTGKGDPLRWGFQVCQWTTPETEKTTHYYWAIAHDFGSQRPLAGAEALFKLMHTVVREDVAAIEAQQCAIDLAPDAPNGAIDADAGLIAARRVVARLFAEEAAMQAVGRS